MPFHKFAAYDMAENMKVNLMDDASELYLVEYDGILRVTRSNIEKVQVEEISGALKEVVVECLNKLNN
jgi:hypothetical protein